MEYIDVLNYSLIVKTFVNLFFFKCTMLFRFTL